jgi:hypothetical protein
MDAVILAVTLGVAFLLAALDGRPKFTMRERLWYKQK